LEDKFIFEFLSNDDTNGKIRRITIDLSIGGDEIASFVKPHIDFVCDTIVRDIVLKLRIRLNLPHYLFRLLTTNLTFTI